MLKTQRQKKKKKKGNLLQWLLHIFSGNLRTVEDPKISIGCCTSLQPRLCALPEKSI